MPRTIGSCRVILLVPIAILAAAGLFALAAEDPKDSRSPVPEPAAQASAEKLVRSLFKDDYAKKAPADVLALAAKLLDQARETKDDRTARFVLFREARDLAAQGADAALALKIVDETAKEYAVNGLEWKTAAVEKAAAATTGIPANKALVETIFGVVAEAQAADDFDAAFRLHKIAEGAALKAKTVALVTTVQARAVQVESLRKAYEAAKLAMAKLAKDPADAPANLTAGKYLCFGKAQWDKGLPLLALGSDAKLKELAKQDLAKPGAAGAQVELADGWTEVAKGMEEPAKTNLQRRALGLYQQALPGLTGLTRTRVEKQVSGLASLLNESRGSTERFTVVSIEQFTTADTTKPLWGTTTERLVFPKWGENTFGKEQVRFQLIEPKDGKKNAIVLRAGWYPNTTFPKEVTVPCKLRCKAIHLLSGVAGSGFPQLKDKSVSMVVQLHYADQTSESHPLINGVHFTNLDAKSEVAGSRVAIKLPLPVPGDPGYATQLRHIVISPKKPTTSIDAIEFMKGDKGDITSPVVMALTVERS